MKSFSQFLTEMAPSQQAARLGLSGDGHGGWYDNKGEFIAKTVGGKLKFYNKRQRTPGQDPPQTEKERNLSQGSTYQEPAAPPEQQAPVEGEIPPEEQQQQPLPVQSPDLAAGPPPVPKSRGTLTIGFGRFNPPHAGHGQLMDIAAQSTQAEIDSDPELESDYIIVPSRTNDPKKNPLDADGKVEALRNLFPDHSAKIVNDPNHRTIFDVLKKAHNDGYTNVRIVAGDDRVKQFDKLSQNYNGQLYDFENMEVISSGAREDDSDDISGYSASRMRLAAAEGDFKTFYSMLHKQVDAVDETGEPIVEVDPETGEPLVDENGEPLIAKDLVPITDRKNAKEYFAAVRSAMGVDEIKEFWNIWEIAPKQDAETLREMYIAGEIFRIGRLVEDVNTGLRGRIIRRGTSYLICVTEDNIMFKSWVKDLTEVVKPAHTTGKYGVSGKEREVGTPELRKYAQSMVPGQGEIKNFDIKEFINKYRKK